MYLHQVILNGVFNYNGFKPISFAINNDEYHIITKLKYTEYWKYGLEKYVCLICNTSEPIELFFDKKREKWFIKTRDLIDCNDIIINDE